MTRVRCTSWGWFVLGVGTRAGRMSAAAPPRAEWCVGTAWPPAPGTSPPRPSQHTSAAASEHPRHTSLNTEDDEDEEEEEKEEAEGWGRGERRVGDEEEEDEEEMMEDVGQG